MKQQQFFIVSEQVMENCISAIRHVPVDGSIKVTISGNLTKSDKQRQLDWKWDGEILKSGIGWNDKDTETVHARSKWLFARPILLRDDELFMSIYSHFMDSWGHDKEKCLEFARDYISTERMTTHQAWEYMTNKQQFWTAKGVNLTDPALYGLELRR